MHLFRRLILSIPTLIIISSIVFFLGKVMPGSSASSFIEQEELLSVSTSLESREKIYRQYVERTGQDKPLFYFSIASLAEPDTLYRVFPENHQEFLQRLCFTYGQWHYISSYYKSIQIFQKRVQTRSENTDKHLELISQVEKLFEATDENEIAETLDEVMLLTRNGGYTGEVIASFSEVRDQFQKLVLHKNKLKKFVPVVQWHGASNQYHAWLSGFLIGDFGKSLRGNRPVLHLIGEALGITLVMTISSLILGWVVSLIIGLIINLPRFQRLEKPVLNTLYFIDTVPLFLLAFLLLVLLSGTEAFQFLPTFGLGNFRQEENTLSRLFILLNHLILPIFCMTLVIIPYLTGQIDRTLKEVAGKIYVTTARAKGLRDHQILLKHILSNAWSPLITIFTENLPALVSGALVVEVIFAIPGMGRLLADAVSARDYPVILGIVVIVAIVKIFSHILADVLYTLADPRIKLGRREVNA